MTLKRTKRCYSLVELDPWNSCSRSEHFHAGQGTSTPSGEQFRKTVSCVEHWPKELPRTDISYGRLVHNSYNTSHIL